MRLGLISDTHIPTAGKEPPPQVVTAFQGVDMIFHAGDLYAPSVIEWLAQIAPVKVSDSQYGAPREGASRVNSPMVVEVEGHTIGLVHALIIPGMTDDAMPGKIAKLWPPRLSFPDALEKIFGRPVDIIVTGYTHVPMIEEHFGVLIVNSGSPSMVGQTPKLGTVAILEVTPGKREATIVSLADVRE